MSAFDKIIGYEDTKTELKQICDMIHNKEYYSALGVRMPRGILFEGDPGVGKTLMANCLIEESGIPAYTIRKNRGSDCFINEITETFRKAKENAPSIVFLDDIDKFANEDQHHRNADEYVAIQSGIDDVRNCEVFVIATTNEIEKLPDSLIRPGRFDKKFVISNPNANDAYKIIKFFLKDKKIADDVNIEDISKMIQYSSCAKVATILNEAGILSAYSRKDEIAMDDIVSAVLRMEYNSPDNSEIKSEEGLNRLALHEAGHTVVSEVLSSGSVGLVSINPWDSDTIRGFIHSCKYLSHYPDNVLIHLGGKAAVEQYYADSHDEGCSDDMRKATSDIRHSIFYNGNSGLSLANPCIQYEHQISENYRSRIEAVVHAELERYMFKTREILIKNKEFLEKTAALLKEKRTLLYSDIKALRESVTIVNVAI